MVGTLALYGRAVQHDFIGLDDGGYVYQNQHVLAGLTWDSVRWAFSAYAVGHWHPLTWLSHMLDVQLFGVAPGWHHLTNVVLHALCTLFVFAGLDRATRDLWCSALVAALFAAHPLRVESVAWIAERKDVLAGLFFFAAIWIYVRYTTSRRIWQLMAVLGTYGLGLMAKPMVVTLPCVLLLLDYWPLRRIGGAAGWRASLLRAGSEKVPFFLLAALASLVTVDAQPIIGLEALPVHARFTNAAASYVRYIGKTVWPQDLAVYYPHSYEIELNPSHVAAVAALIAATALAVWSAPRRPYLAVGWLWFVGTLVPVIGLVQVGDQALADRYTYIPSVGLMIAAMWSAREIANRRQLPIAARAVAAGVVLLALSIATWRQLGHWRDTESLFEHTVAVTEDNSTAEAVLGSLRLDQGRLDEATNHLRTALRIDPHYARAHYLLGIVLVRQERLEEALRHYASSVEHDPENAAFRVAYANALLQAGQVEDAIARYREALGIDPDNAIANFNLGVTLRARGQADTALPLLERYSQLVPDDPDVHLELGDLYSTLQNRRRARDHYEEALRLDPENERAANALSEIDD